jgi:hypothetical protein
VAILDGPAGGYATSVLAPKNEAAFNKIWHYEDALCIAQDFFRDSFVRSRHNGL